MPRSKYLLAVAVCLAGAAILGHPGSAAAATNWTGTIDANWGTVGNWDNGLPIAGADATVDGGTYSAVLDVDAAAGNLRIGTTVGSQLDIPNANSLTLDAALFLGGPAATLSVLNQSAGAVTVPHTLWIGGTSAGQTGTSQYYLSGTGLLNVGWQIGVGQTGTGLLEQTGGTIVNGGSLFIGDAYYETGAVGVYNLSGGVYNGPASSVSAVGVWGGSGTLAISGTGVMNEASLTMGLGVYGNTAGSTSFINLSDSGALNLTGSLTLAANAATVGTLTQTGGTLTVPTLLNGPGTGTYNLTGGTLNVSAVPDMDLANNGATLNVGGAGAIETLVFGDPGGDPVNMALGKTATQSSNPWGYNPGNAVDGNYGNFCHTDSLQNSWWKVDLTGNASTVPISDIRITARYDGYNEHFSNFFVRVLDDDGATVLWQDKFITDPSEYLSAAEVLSISVPGAVEGRYVEVQIDGLNLISTGYLFFTEMEVYDSSVLTPSAYTDYTQSNSSTLGIELDPTNALCDKLVAGELSLDGTLNVTSLGGAFANGQVFDILDWDSLSGTFETVYLPTLAGGLSWDTSDLYTTGELRVVPEPATMSLLILGLIGAARLTRRRR